MAGKAPDITGKRFGKLVVVSRINGHRGQGIGARWLCQCDCGKMTTVSASELRRTRNPVRSCGCLLAKLRPYEAIYNGLVKSAKKRKLEYFSYEEFLTFTTINKCHYCGKDVEWKKHINDNNRKYNLDRKDSSIGYTVDNVVVCCLECNRAKVDRYSFDEWLYLSTH